MNIEEKARAYDEALKKARILVGYPTTQPFISDLQDLFPELKESEDERIRKELLNYLYDVHDDDEERARWIAWLEKQGEQKPTDNEMIEILRAEYEKGRANAIVEMQNHTWSEEDKKILKEIITDVRFEGYNNDLQANSYRKIRWLKSLRPQNRWKPSEEQMKALKEACDEHREPDGLDPLYTLYQDLKKLREE